MIDAGLFVEAAARRGVRLFTGVPCSYLKPFINYVIDAPEIRYVPAANEGDAVAIATGSELAGQHAAVMFQNSGLGNAVNPLTSLNYSFQLPVLLIVTLRGEPGGPHDEPQHELMGRITTRLLETMEIRWEYFPDAAANIEPTLDRALDAMLTHRLPYALVMRQGTVADYKLRSRPVERTLECAAGAAANQVPVATRAEMLRAVQASTEPSDVIVATTGYTGRELYALGDRENQIYLVGSMGCASSVGLGMAIAQPQRRVIVLDGDGAALMRLGSLATIGYERPRNLRHMLLDNGVHESTGGQSTVSRSLDFCQIAAACGYARTARVTTATELAREVAADARGLSFVHVPICPGVQEKLPRPTIAPPAVAQRLQRFLTGTTGCEPCC